MLGGQGVKARAFAPGEHECQYFSVWHASDSFFFASASPRTDQLKEKGVALT